MEPCAMSPALPLRDYRWKHRLNRLSGHLDCRFLEWSGWYNQDLGQRLLGHFRLYQIFKKENDEHPALATPLAYILNYRSTQGLKLLLSHATSLVYKAGTFGSCYPALHIESFNRMLLFQFPHLLEVFLSDAEKDFDLAQLEALEQIRQLHFKSSQTVRQYNLLLMRQERKTIHNTHNYFIDQHVEPASYLRGKEKGVFSKRQILIFLDLLSELGKLEKIDFARPNKYDAVADTLFALTGKSKESWTRELRGLKSRGLYDFRDLGELNQLLIILTNLSDTFRKAGFRTLAALADKKLAALDKMKDKMSL